MIAACWWTFLLLMLNVDREKASSVLGSSAPRPPVSWNKGAAAGFDELQPWFTLHASPIDRLLVLHTLATCHELDCTHSLISYSVSYLSTTFSSTHESRLLTSLSISLMGKPCAVTESSAIETTGSLLKRSRLLPKPLLAFASSPNYP